MPSTTLMPRRMDESLPPELPTASASNASLSSGDDNRREALKSLQGRAILYATIAIVGAATDLWSKQAIFAWRGLPGEKDIWWIIDGYFGIETAVNIGAVFGIGAGQGTVFALLSIVAAIGIVVWLFRFRAAESLWLTVALGMISGGIVGNLYDRVGMWWQPGYPPEWRSGVRDWILWQASDSWKWPNFNIADSLLVVGAGMLLYHSFFMMEVDSSDQPDSTTPA
jgi:signal peptidase II